MLSWAGNSGALDAKTAAATGVSRIDPTTGVETVLAGATAGLLTTAADGTVYLATAAGSDRTTLRAVTATGVGSAVTVNHAVTQFAATSGGLVASWTSADGTAAGYSRVNPATGAEKVLFTVPTDAASTDAGGKAYGVGRLLASGTGSFVASSSVSGTAAQTAVVRVDATAGTGQEVGRYDWTGLAAVTIPTAVTTPLPPPGVPPVSGVPPGSAGRAHPALAAGRRRHLHGVSSSTNSLVTLFDGAGVAVRQVLAFPQTQAGRRGDGGGGRLHRRRRHGRGGRHRGRGGVAGGRERRPDRGRGDAVQPVRGGVRGRGERGRGDLNGDGTPELVVTAAAGGGPRVRVFDGRTFAPLADFYAVEDASYRGGTTAAVGTLGTGTAPALVVAAGVGGGPRVAVWDGASVLARQPDPPGRRLLRLRRRLPRRHRRGHRGDPRRPG